MAAAAIFCVGAAVGALNLRLQRARLTRDLIQDAEAAAVAFDASALEHLSAPPASSGGYELVQHRLQRLQAAERRIQHLYLLRADGSPPQLAVIAEATSPGSPTPPAVGPRAVDWPDAASGIARQSGSFVTFGDTLDGQPVTAFASIADRRGGPAFLLAADASGAQWTGELSLAAARGALYAWVLLGVPLFALYSARRQGEQREAIHNLSQAVEQSHSAIMILDLQHRIEYANRGLCQQIGYSRRELIGRYWQELLTGPDASTTVAELVATIRTGQPWEGDWTNRRKDGSPYAVHGRVTPVKHSDGTTTCFVAIFDDVTERKRREAELRDARDLAQAGDRAKGQFLATMSHEVRTPLNGIVGFTSLLLDTPLSAEQREFVQTIRASGEALIQLTADILDFARIDSGKLKLDPVACDPRECIEEALDLHASRAMEKRIELLHRVGDDVPAAVLVDAGRLRQVLVNLIGNAVKFTDRGEVEVTLRCIGFGGPTPDAKPIDGLEPGLDPPCTLEFTIRDTGIGIAPGHHARLFKPFSQLDESSTRRFGGAGLGLAISKNLVQSMGGDIRFASAPGRGSAFTFTVRVPAIEAAPPARHLDGLKVGLVIESECLRREVTELLDTWGAAIRPLASAADLNEHTVEVALVEVSPTAAADLAQRAEPLPGSAPERSLALVPLSLPTELRSGLRTHFRLLVNRPLHHGPLFALLSGSRPALARDAGPSRQFGFHALIVEDNAVNQRLVQRVLTTFGCTWHVVPDGREALKELGQRADAYDVVLLDLHMPHLDGLSLLELLRRGEVGALAQTLWVVVLTADARPEQRARAFACGVNDYLTKPLRLSELEAALERYRTAQGEAAG